MNIKKRLEKLEATTGDGGVLYVDTCLMEDDEADRAIKQAERQAGKRGTVIIIQNIDKHPLPKDAKVMLRIRPEYWEAL